jgi:FtsH-binding integral membrane protein
MENSTITRVRARDQLVTAVSRNVFFGIMVFIAGNFLLQTFVAPQSLRSLSLVGLFGLIGIDWLFDANRSNGATLQGVFFLYSFLYSCLTAGYISMFASETIMTAALISSGFLGLSFWIAQNMAISYKDIRTIMWTLLGFSLVSILNVFFLKLPIIELAVSCVGMVAMTALISFYIDVVRTLDYRPQDVDKVSFQLSVQIMSSVVNLFMYVLRFLEATNSSKRK